MRLTVVALVFCLVTVALGFTGYVGDLADYFKLLSIFFLILFACLLLNQLKRRAA